MESTFHITETLALTTEPSEASIVVRYSIGWQSTQ